MSLAVFSTNSFPELWLPKMSLQSCQWHLPIHYIFPDWNVHWVTVIMWNEHQSPQRPHPPCAISMPISLSGYWATWWIKWEAGVSGPEWALARPLSRASSYFAILKDWTSEGKSESPRESAVERAVTSHFIQLLSVLPENCVVHTESVMGMEDSVT